MDELQKLLISNGQLARIAIFMGALSALITSIGTVIAAIVSAFRHGGK